VPLRSVTEAFTVKMKLLALLSCSAAEPLFYRGRKGTSRLFGGGGGEEKLVTAAGGTGPSGGGIPLFLRALYA